MDVLGLRYMIKKQEIDGLWVRTGMEREKRVIKRKVKMDGES